MADITLHDVLAWEPRLQLSRRPLLGMPLTGDAGEREVSWAVTMRAAAPMLNPLRGGELVLLSDRVLAESGLALPVLLRELGSHEVSAAVVETPPAVASSIPVLIAPDLSIEFETYLNRMLTERRGDLYRAGTELGRLLSVSGAGADLTGLVRTASDFLGCPMAVMNARGAVVERRGDDAVPAGASRTVLTMSSAREWRDNRFLVQLAAGDVLWFGPVPPAGRALVRLAADRIAVAVEALALRTFDERPRGADRSAAINALLLDSSDAAVRAAPLLGLEPDARYRVLLLRSETDLAGAHRSLQAFGETHEAGTIDDLRAIVLQARSGSGDGSTLSRPTRGSAPNPAAEWIAISSEVRGSGQLPVAARQARFVATLIRGGALPPASAAFDQLADIGVHQLLFEVWGMPALSSFIEEALGDLRARDRRGTLRATLLAYMDAGGSQIETAATLGIHRNTLSYRLRQISQLLGRDPDDPAMRLVTHLALVAEKLPDWSVAGSR